MVEKQILFRQDPHGDHRLRTSTKLPGGADAHAPQHTRAASEEKAARETEDSRLPAAWSVSNWLRLSEPTPASVRGGTASTYLNSQGEGEGETARAGTRDRASTRSRMHSSSSDASHCRWLPEEPSVELQVKREDRLGPRTLLAQPHKVIWKGHIAHLCVCVCPSLCLHLKLTTFVSQLHFQFF